MIKRTLYFGHAYHLSKKDKQLKIKSEEQEEDKTVPIEDIGLMVLDNPQITITNALIFSLMENNTVLISCNNSHIPYSIMLPMSANTEFTETALKQVDVALPIKKQLWKQTIIQKVKNQAALLDWLQVPSAYLNNLVSKVKSGDSGNVEAQAANFYWNSLFCSDHRFIRHRFGEPPNNLLNYGYAILRAVVARALVSSGLLLVLGIHHKSKYNPYCLADDIMEPYRPFVDKVVVQMKYDEQEQNIDKESKKILLGIPSMDVFIDNEKSPLMIAAQRTAASLVKCIFKEQEKLLYPELC